MTPDSSMLPAPPQSPLTEADLAAVVRIMGDVIAVPGNLTQQRRLLMERLCEWIGADAWLWCLADYTPDRQLGHAGLLHGGFDDSRFAVFLEAINHPAMEEVSRHSALELQEHGCHITRGLRQLELPGARLMDSAAGTLMLSLRPMETGGITGIGMYRNIGKPEFTRREIRIAHILLSEMPWLHFHSFPEQMIITRLYPRHRTVLNCLCEGWPRKKIAAHLGLSLNTVHGYTKEVFKHFGVHSQSELVSRLGKGDGGDG